MAWTNCLIRARVLWRNLRENILTNIRVWKLFFLVTLARSNTRQSISINFCDFKEVLLNENGFQQVYECDITSRRHSRRLDVPAKASEIIHQISSGEWPRSWMKQMANYSYNEIFVILDFSSLISLAAVVGLRKN